MVRGPPPPTVRDQITDPRNDAVLNVEDRLARIEGVGQGATLGAGDYPMRVWLDPQKGRRTWPHPPATSCAIGTARRPPPEL